MSEALYERYKDALRRGHIAALRGRHDDALVAYRAAIELAPDRPLPHASVGATLLRLNRPEEAVAAFDAALQRSATDEAALNGRAEALVALGRPADAATTLDQLADALDRADRLGDACDAARRALELAESRSRRRHVRDLVGRLRSVDADPAAAAALARAVQVLEPPTTEGRGVDVADVPSAPTPPVAADPPAARPDALALVEAAETALAAEDRPEAVALLRSALEAHRARGEWSAALDAAIRALAIDATATDVHIGLAELYGDRGWRALATEKLLLLSRLATLADDEATLGRLRTVAARVAPDRSDLDAVLAARADPA